MKIRYTVALSMLAGTTIGGVATHSLHAQSKPPIYLIAQNEVINPGIPERVFRSNSRHWWKHYPARQAAT
jgi:hypothetical protein